VLPQPPPPTGDLTMTVAIRACMLRALGQQHRGLESLMRGLTAELLTVSTVTRAACPGVAASARDHCQFLSTELDAHERRMVSVNLDRRPCPR
jgi:hypothetical protein